MTAVATLDKVTKRYGKQAAVNEVTLELGSGQCIALVGHNGAGKTTLIKMMLGLTHATSGRIRVLGEDPLSQGGQRARLEIGYLPESVAFPASLTGREMLRFYARLKRRPVSECDELLARVGLVEAAHKRIGAYSKGMRQRLGLAQALLGTPRLLLLDEPTSGLDPLLRHEFFEIIRGLTTAGTTVILASHVLTELEARTDLAAILREGRLVAFGDIEQLRIGAGLPVTMRVRGDARTIAKKLDGSFVKTIGPNGGSITIDCAPKDKMALLRLLAGFGDACADVEIHPPSLDDLYLYYSGRNASEGNDMKTRP
jgi:Cu-processing system ATP-binding protein